LDAKGGISLVGKGGRVLKTLRKIMKDVGHKSYKRKRKKKSRRKKN
jgi:predicted RNA-binding protein YlqC (UPF0109 family)